MLLKSDTQPSAESVHSFNFDCISSVTHRDRPAKITWQPHLIFLKLDLRGEVGLSKEVKATCCCCLVSLLIFLLRRNRMKGEVSCTGANTHKAVCIFGFRASDTNTLKCCILLPHSARYPHPPSILTPARQGVKSLICYTSFSKLRPIW